MCTRIMENLYDVTPASNPATPLRLRATAVQYGRNGGRWRMVQVQVVWRRSGAPREPALASLLRRSHALCILFDGSTKGFKQIYTPPSRPHHHMLLLMVAPRKTHCRYWSAMHRSEVGRRRASRAHQRSAW